MIIFVEDTASFKAAKFLFEDIAIEVCGANGHFRGPGEINTPDEFWDFLKNGKYAADTSQLAARRFILCVNPKAMQPLSHLKRIGKTNGTEAFHPGGGLSPDESL